MSRTDSPGNILLVANWESNVGYAWWLMENFWVSIDRHFSAKGQQSYLAYPRVTEIPESIKRASINVVEVNFRDRSPTGRRRLRDLVKMKGIRNVYLSDAPAWSFFYLYLRVWGVRRIVVHDHVPGERTRPSMPRRWVKLLIQRLPWVTADHYIAVTGFVRRRMLEIACIPARKCSVAPNGIVPIELPVAKPGFARHEFGIPAERRIIVSTGRAALYKGIDFILDCMAELVHNRQVTELHFLFCGDGPDLDRFIEQAGNSGIADYVTFAGRRSDIRTILPSCDIGMHASHGEVGYSLSILEYMSAGLTTLVPDRPSTAEAIAHDENGLLFRPGDVRHACDLLQRCLDEQVRGRLSGKAITTVAVNYSLEKTNKELVRILDPLFS